MQTLNDRPVYAPDPQQQGTALNQLPEGLGKIHMPHPQVGAAVPYANGDLVVLSAHNAVFPQICPKCGTHATTRKEVKLNYTPPWVNIFILAGLILYVIIGGLLSKKATVNPFICDDCRKKAGLFRWAGLVGLGVFLVALLIGIDKASGLLVIAAFVFLIAGFIVAGVKGKLLTCKKIENDIVTLHKTHPNFRAALPRL